MPVVTPTLQGKCQQVISNLHFLLLKSQTQPGDCDTCLGLILTRSGVAMVPQAIAQLHPMSPLCSGTQSAQRGAGAGLAHPS